MRKLPPGSHRRIIGTEKPAALPEPHSTRQAKPPKPSNQPQSRKLPISFKDLGLAALGFGCVMVSGVVLLILSGVIMMIINYFYPLPSWQILPESWDIRIKYLLAILWFVFIAFLAFLPDILPVLIQERRSRRQEATAVPPSPPSPQPISSDLASASNLPPAGWPAAEWKLLDDDWRTKKLSALHDFHATRQANPPKTLNPPKPPKTPKPQQPRKTPLPWKELGEPMLELVSAVVYTVVLLVVSGVSLLVVDHFYDVSSLQIFPESWKTRLNYLGILFFSVVMVFFLYFADVFIVLVRWRRANQQEATAPPPSSSAATKSEPTKSPD